MPDDVDYHFVAVLPGDTHASVDVGIFHEVGTTWYF